LMIRKEPWRLVQQLKKLDGSSPSGSGGCSLRGKSIAVSGQRGCGKSATLLYLSDYTRASGWLQLFTTGLEFTHETLGFISPSKTHEGVFDQGRYTAKYFSHLVETQSEALSKIRLKSKQKHTNSSHQTLLDLVNLGSQNVQIAPDLLWTFVDEVQAADEVPTIVLIDDINFWDEKSTFVDPDVKYGQKNLSSNKLALVAAFRSFISKAPTRGLTVLATTSTATMRHAKDMLSPFENVVMMKPYSDNELLSAAQHYSVSGMVDTHPEQLTIQWLAICKAISGGSLFVVFLISSYRGPT